MKVRQIRILVIGEVLAPAFRAPSDVTFRVVVNIITVRVLNLVRMVVR